MKYGHVTGTKRERTGSSKWYTAQEEEHIRKIEAEWSATQDKHETPHAAPASGATQCPEQHFDHDRLHSGNAHKQGS
jgi:hypothetical protein